MHFSVLGPLRIDGVHGPVSTPGGRSAVALCWLIANANRSVSLDELISVLWPQPPTTAVAKTRMLVRSLAPLLDPESLQVDPQIRLTASDDAVDAWRFQWLIGEADNHLAAADAGRAKANLQDALALWRSAPYPELDRALPAIAMIDRLIELHLGAIEQLNSLALAEPVGYPLVAELRALAILHPDRPRLRRQLALALYRTDRQIEALATLRELRAERGDADGRAELLQAAMLRHDPGLNDGQLTDGELPPRP